MNTPKLPELEGLEAFSVNIEEGIAHVQLNCPDTLNSMTEAFWRELPVLVRAIDRAAAARVIVISSTGRHFSAGMDLSVFMNMGSSFDGEPARRGENFRRWVLELQGSFNALEEARIPVLVAVQGACVGGAVDMISACCSRYCTSNAYFNIKETEIGMTADVGTLQRLPHLIPQGLVRELAYTSRKLHADEALRCGLVNQVFDTQEEMLEGVMLIAKRIASNSPVAVAGTKHQLNYTRDHSVTDSLDYMATWQSGMFQMPDIEEAMTAAMEKRQAIYEDLWPTKSLMD
jgi:enoyl-CoA hydratase